MTDWWRNSTPQAILLVLIATASLAFGADTPVATYLFSGLIMLLGAAVLLAGRGISVPLGAFGVVALIVAFVLIDVSRGRLMTALPDYAALAAAGAVFLIARSGAMTAKRVPVLWSLTLALMMLIALWAFIDFIIHPDTIHGRARPYHLGRLSAAFLSANTAATFFGVTLLAGTAGLLRAFGRIVSFHVVDIMEGVFRHGALSLMTVLFSGICLMLTASRAGIAFACLALILLVGWEIVAGRQREGAGRRSALVFGLAGAVIAAMALAGVWSLSGELATERYGELTVDSDIRLTMFSAEWQAIWQAPLFGTGFGSFGAVNTAAMTPDNAHVLSGQGAAHNIVLQWLIQTGFVGTGAATAVMGAIVARIIAGLSRRRRQRTLLRAISVIALFVFLHGLVDYALEIPGFMWWFAWILGIGAGIAAGQRGTRRQGRGKRRRSSRSRPASEGALSR